MPSYRTSTGNTKDTGFRFFDEYSIGSVDIVRNGLMFHTDVADSKSLQSENYVTYSTYNSSTWSNAIPSGASIATGIDAPDGTNTAVRFTCNNTGSAVFRVSFPSFVPNGTDVYTTSFYVRKISGTGNAGTDLNDGNPSKFYNTELITNEWVRIVTTGVPTATSKIFLDLFSDSNTNYVLDFWGVQVERGLTASDYTPTSGSIVLRNSYWADLSGNGRHFQLSGSPLTTTLNGGGIIFDGVDDIASYSLSLGSLTQYTVSYWGRADAVNRMPISFNTNNTFYWFGDNSWKHPSGEYYYPKTVSIPLETWGHYTVTYNGSNISIYRQGIFEGQQSVSGTVTISSAKIGDWTDANSQYNYQGIISSVSIYNRALSTSEVQQNFNALRRRYGL
jgi:hypothetical protein